MVLCTTGKSYRGVMYGSVQQKLNSSCPDTEQAAFPSSDLMAGSIQENTGKPSVIQENTGKHWNVTKKVLTLDRGLNYMTFKEIFNFTLL